MLSSNFLYNASCSNLDSRSALFPTVMYANIRIRQRWDERAKAKQASQSGASVVQSDVPVPKQIKGATSFSSYHGDDDYNSGRNIDYEQDYFSQL